MKSSTARVLTIRSGGEGSEKKEQHACLDADLLSTLERVVVAGHVRHDSSLIRLGSVDQIYVISREH